MEISRLLTRFTTPPRHCFSSPAATVIDRTPIQLRPHSCLASVPALRPCRPCSPTPLVPRRRRHSPSRPLFAGSFLSIVQILLDQMAHDEMRIVGCESLFYFINNQEMKKKLPLQEKGQISEKDR
ncbi:PREDICTED: uncharacterized protein LOC109190004 [Ipomoea nil]|uniref:uncharacterized protein LOC109190004 n=1 Tax=Ipomoea nil TaxID=35883 RepID=UPI0009010437|nr:PREDICTED: uncharacterized protein LOC109190004 [Ipomoea nil]